MILPAVVAGTALAVLGVVVAVADPDGQDEPTISLTGLDTAGLDNSVDGVLGVYCLLHVDGDTVDADAQLSLPGFDPNELVATQWVHEVIGDSDGSADAISAAFASPAVESDLDAASHTLLTDGTKTFLFQNQVPLIAVQTIYPFRTGPSTATVLTTYELDGAPQMLTQTWTVDSGEWQRV